jgi:hypothetical protein
MEPKYNPNVNLNCADHRIAVAALRAKLENGSQIADRLRLNTNYYDGRQAVREVQAAQWGEFERGYAAIR